MSDDTTTGAQLAAQVVNTGCGVTVDNVLYMADDTTSNQAVLQLLISSGQSELVPGEVVAPEDLPPTGPQSLFYLDLSPLALAASAWGALKPAAEGWTCVAYPDDQVVGMAPSTAVTIAAGDPVSIALTGLEIAAAPPSQTPQLSVTYYNVPGVTTGNTSWVANFTVAVQNPPHGSANLTDDLALDVESDEVLNSVGAPTTAYNSLVLQLSQTSGGTTVLAGPDTVFTVSFVYGKDNDPLGYGALATTKQAHSFTIAKGDNAEEWVLDAQPTQNPSWTLKPPAGKPIVGTGVAAVTSVVFGNIVTDYQAGATVMLVQYEGVPGYRSGAYTCVLDKLAHVTVGPVTVSPAVTYLHNGSAEVTVSWSTTNATALELTQNYQQQPVTGTSTKATLTSQRTVFNLQATGPRPDLGNVACGTATAIALPVVNSLTGAPLDIWSGSGSHGIDLCWAVDTNGKVELTSTSGDVSGSGYEPTQSAPFTVRRPTLVTCSAVTDPGVTAPSRSLVIDAFVPFVLSHPLNGTSTAAAASPTAPFVAVASASPAQVVALDTVAYISMASVTVPGPPTALVFSADGSLMVTLCSNNTVALYQVSVTQGVPTFTTAGAVHLDGAPQAATVTPDLATIYISVAGTPGTVVALARESGSYQVKHTVTVGNAPAGLAVHPSGGRLFVANSADDSVSVVGVGLDGMLQVTGTATGVTHQPQGVAVSADGTTLLVACTASNTLWAIDSTNPGTGERQPLTVGQKPVSVAVTPGGGYAFVANSGDGTVSLVDVWNGTTQCTVLEQGIKVGLQPCGVSVSPDGLTVLVPDSALPALGLVSLQTYTLATVSNDLGTAPTDVVVAPDSSAALTWHNSLISAPTSQPGAVYFPLSSEVGTEILTDIPMVACTFGPSTAEGVPTAYAIGNAVQLLYVIDLRDPAAPKETDVPLPVQVRTYGLAVSQVDSTVFLVVQDRTRVYSLLVGSVSTSGVWTTQQTVPLYPGQSVGPVRTALSPDASTLLVADTGNHILTVVRRAPNGTYSVHSPGLGITDAVGASFLPDGSKAFILQGGLPSVITVLDPATLTASPASVLQSYTDLQQLAPSPDGRRLYAADLSAASLRILDSGSLRILQTLQLATNLSQAQGASGTAVSPDGSHVFVANTDSGTVSVLQQVPM